MADDPTPDETPEPDATPDPEPDDKPLGPSGERALAEWKARAREAEKQLKFTEGDFNNPIAKKIMERAAKADEYEEELAKLREAQMSEQEKAIEQARKEAAESARGEVLSTVNGRLFRSELKAATASKLNDNAINDLLTDTDVALKLLGLDEIPVTDSGDIDSEAISQAVGSYVEARPYLAASATQRPGAIEQGARGTTTPVKTVDEQIAEAEAAGDYKTSGRLKTQKMLAAPSG